METASQIRSPLSSNEKLRPLLNRFLARRSPRLLLRGHAVTAASPQLRTRITTPSALVASGKLHANLELGQGHFARGIERRLAQVPRGRGIPEEQRAPIAHAQAGALLSLLQWWIGRGMSRSPAEMDDLYHRLVWCGVNSDCR